MSGSTEQQPQPPADLNAAIQALIRQQIAAASGQPQVQLPAMPTPQAQTQYSNDPEKGPDLLARIGLAIGGGSLPGAPAELRQQMGKQALLNFGIGLLGAGKFSTPGQVLAGGLRGAQAGLLGSEAAQAGQQEYALNAQAKLAELASAQQKNRTEALTALVPLLQMQGRMGLPPLFGPGSATGGEPGGGAGGGDTALTGEWEHDAPIIAKRESGGDPTALNYVAKADPTAYDRGATASGKYQIVNSTWREGMQLAGLDPAKYPTARSAPEAVQDQVAKAIYGKYGTAPWDASKFGANWVQQPNGTYQLVKGAPPPASGPGSAVGPYKVAGPPVAPPAPAGGGGTTAALPLPPEVPGPGAVPTVTTPEEASATAKAAGMPVQVPGGQGLWAKPEGGTTSYPGLIMPGTQAAGPATPPAGPVTPPPAPQQPPPATPPATPPAEPPAAPTQPATTAPTQPAGPPVSLEDYAQRHGAGTLDQPNPASVKAADENIRVAQRLLQEGYRSGASQADLTKARGDVQAAQNERDKLFSDAREKFYSSIVMPAYKAEILDPWTQSANQQQQAATQIQLKKLEGEQAQELAAANQGRTVVNKRMEALQAKADVGHSMLRNVSVLETLATQMGDASLLLAKHPDLRDALVAFGVGTKDQLDSMRTSQAWDRAVSSFFQDTHVAGTGNPSEKEGEWMMRQFGGPEQTPEDRLTQLSIIRKLAAARIQDHSDAQEVYDANNGLKLTGLNERIKARSNLFDRPPTWDANNPDNTAVQGRYVMGHPRGEPYAAYWDTGGGKMELRYTRNEMVQDRQTGKMRLQPVPMLGGSLVVGQ